MRERLTDWNKEWAACAEEAAENSRNELLPVWFNQFLTNVCELPDRNSPDDEPEAVVATLEELRNCAINAIEQCAAPTPTVVADAAAPTLLGSPAEGHWGEPETPSDGHKLESDVDEEAQPDERIACMCSGLGPCECPGDVSCRIARATAPQATVMGGEPCGHDYTRSDGVCTECGSVTPIKDHEIAEVVNRLRDTAKAWGKTQQLRERIAAIVVPALRRAAVPQAGALTDEQVNAIVEQAQVFASAWSLVGGRFDFGNALQDAEEAKAELRTMLARAGGSDAR